MNSGWKGLAHKQSKERRAKLKSKHNRVTKSRAKAYKRSQIELTGTPLVKPISDDFKELPNFLSGIKFNED